MRYLLTLLVIYLLTAPAGATKYYLSPSGNDNSGSGTISSPWFSPSKAWAGINAGDTIYMRGGTYSYYHQSSIYLQNKNGTNGNRIKLWNYPGELPVITKATGYPDTWGMYLSGNYIHLKGLKITGFAQKDSVGYRNNSYAVWAIGCNNCLFENLEISYNGCGFFLQGSMSASGGPCTGNVILNCDFHHNKDPYTPSPNTYGNASGLSVNRISSGTNYISGCRSWLNTDEGIDFWLNNGVMVVYNTWCWDNGYLPADREGDTDPKTLTTGNGDGFKLGPCYTASSGTIRYLYRCISAHNGGLSAFGGFGYDDNVGAYYGYACNIVNCIAYGNQNQGFNLNTGTFAHYLANNISIGNNSNGNQAYIEAYSTVATSTFLVGTGQRNDNFPVSASSFVSVDISQLAAARQSDNSLPYADCFMLKSTSTELINSGTVVADYSGNNIIYTGSAPDLGALEYLPLKTTGTVTIGKKVTHSKKIRK